MTYKLNIDANASFETRTGIITIKQTESGKTINVNVIQSGKDPYEFKVHPITAFMKADGTTTLNPTITSTKYDIAQNFDVDDYSDWLHVSKSDNEITIVADVNESTSIRSGFVRFIQDESNNTCGIDITQGPADQFIISNIPEGSVSADGLNTTLNVASVVDGEARSPYTVESSPNWINASAAVGLSKIALQISANNTASSRTGNIVCKQTATGKTFTVTITQDAKD